VVCGAALIVGAAALSLIKDTAEVSEWQRVLLAGLPAAGLIWGACFWAPSGAPRMWAALRALGDRSYVLYLCHFPILMVLGAWMEATGRGGWGNIALYVALGVAGTAVATEVLHRFVERPTLKLAHAAAKRIARPRDKAPAPAPAALPTGA
jgi:peptidoglycan/LPS O-acetylase OafA/YrhL